MNKIIVFLFFFFHLIVISQNSIPTKVEESSFSNKLEQEKKQALLEKSNYYLQEGIKPDSSLYYIDKLKKLALTTSDSLLIAKAFALKFDVYYNKSDYELALENGKKAIDIYTNLQANVKMAKMMKKVGDTYQILYKNPEALQYFLQAEKYLSAYDKIKLYTGIGTVYGQTNDLDKSIDYYLKSYHISDSLQVNDYDYDIYNGLAIAYSKNGDNDQSLNYLHKALEVTIKDENIRGQAICYHNIGYRNYLVENYTEAINSFLLGESLFKDVVNKHIKASTYLHLSKSYTEINEFNKAEEALEKSIQFYTKMNNNDGLANTLLVKATISQKNNNLKEAINFAEEALKLSKESGNINFRSNLLFFLSELYEENKSSNKALSNFKEYMVLKDSIFNSKKIKEIENLKVKFDVEKLEKQILVSQQEVLLKDNELTILETKQKNTLYKTTLLILLLLGTLFYIFKQRKLNQITKKKIKTDKELSKLIEIRAKENIEFKKRRITEYALHIEDKNKTLDRIRTLISELKNQTEDSAVKQRLLNLIHFIEDETEMNKGKIEIDTQNSEGHETFIYKLKEKYPNLSPKEVKVCTLLYLNFTSKQIAEKLRIREQSVNNYRFNIRKKIKLDKDHNLTEFLKEL